MPRDMGRKQGIRIEIGPEDDGNTGSAKEYFNRGIDAYEQENYPLARDMFEKVFDTGGPTMQREAQSYLDEIDAVEADGGTEEPAVDEEGLVPEEEMADEEVMDEEEVPIEEDEYVDEEEPEDTEDMEYANEARDFYAKNKKKLKKRG